MIGYSKSLQLLESRLLPVVLVCTEHLGWGTGRPTSVDRDGGSTLVCDWRLGDGVILPGKCKLDSVWTGPYLVVALLGWTVGIQKHLDVPVILIHCQDVKKVPQPSGVQSWIAAPQPVGAPAVLMLGASTVAHISRGSPSITALPPDEGIVLADADSVCNGRFTSHDRVSGHASAPSDDSRMAPMTDSVSPTDLLLPRRLFGSMTLVPYTRFPCISWMRVPFA